MVCGDEGLWKRVEGVGWRLRRETGGAAALIMADSDQVRGMHARAIRRRLK